MKRTMDADDALEHIISGGYSTPVEKKIYVKGDETIERTKPDLKINMSNYEEVKKSLDTKSLRVCVIGIGRIGLPTALSFAKSGLQTIGVDINEKLVQDINSKKFPLKDEPGYENIFNDVLEKKLFSATTKIKDAVSNSDLILLSLPTPMDENNIPDYSALTTVASQLSDILTLNLLLYLNQYFHKRP